RRRGEADAGERSRQIVRRQSVGGLNASTFPARLPGARTLAPEGQGMAVTGERILQLGRKHIGEPYVLGSLAPKNNPKWKGPWDCAEFASWLVFQAADVLYGCASDSGDPASADAYTGYWARDAETLGVKIGVDQAMRTPGAAVLRSPKPGATGHIVISDGRGGTVEAHSAKAGVIASTMSGRRWDIGVLVPGIEYSERDAGEDIEGPKVVVYRLTEPH